MLEIQCEWQSLSCSKHDPYICLNYAELTQKKASPWNIGNLIAKKIDIVAMCSG
jgi:hypothetical protein